eukprot:10273642-Heterocapsa_arctica.AAC.1
MKVELRTVFKLEGHTAVPLSTHTRSHLAVAGEELEEEEPPQPRGPPELLLEGLAEPVDDLVVRQ